MRRRRARDTARRADALVRSELCRGPAASAVIPVLRKSAPTWFAQFPWLVDDADRAGLERELRGVTSDRMLRELAQFSPYGRLVTRRRELFEGQTPRTG